MIVTYVYPAETDNWENVEWRCFIPAAAINRTGIHKANVISDTEFSYNSNECITTCLESDIIIIYKKVYGRVISAIHHWQAREKTILVDFDEAYQLLDPLSDEYKFWFDGIQMTKEKNVKYISPAPMTQFKWGLKLVDGITVPSERLANDWMSFNEIGVVPNYINLDSYAAANRKKRNGNISFGWHGKNINLLALQQTGLLEAMQTILAQHSDAKMYLYIDDELNFDLGPINKEQIKIFEHTKKTDWQGILAHIDIGLLPLLGSFDQRQSMRTVLEYMVMKIPWIASQSSAYHEMDNYGEIVGNTKDNWQMKLEEMIRHYDGFKTNATQEPYLYGIEKSVDENIYHTIELYKKFIAYKKR